jgi:hypothetical protein
VTVSRLSVGAVWELGMPGTHEVLAAVDSDWTQSDDPE